MTTTTTTASTHQRPEDFPALSRISIISSILPFLTDDIYEAVKISFVSSSWRDAVQNYSAELWMQIWKKISSLTTAQAASLLFSDDDHSSSSWKKHGSRDTNNNTKSTSLNLVEKFDLVRKFCRIFGCAPCKTFVFNNIAKATDSHHEENNNNNNNNDDEITHHSTSSSSPSFISKWMVNALHYQGQANFNVLLYNSDFGSALHVAIARYASVPCVEFLLEHCDVDPNFCGLAQILYTASFAGGAGHYNNSHHKHHHHHHSSNTNLNNSNTKVIGSSMFVSPIYVACSKLSSDHDAIVRLLLKYGASPQHYLTPSTLAVLLSLRSTASHDTSLNNENINISFTEMILKEGPKDKTLLMNACEQSSLEVVDLLLTHRRSKDKKHATKEFSVNVNERKVHSSKKNIADFIQNKYLLSSSGGSGNDDESRGKDSFPASDLGKNVLESLIERNLERDKDLLKLLIFHKDNPVDVTSPHPRNGRTPLLLACKVRNLTAVSVLLQHKKLNLSAFCESGKNAVSYCVTENSSSDSKQLSSVVFDENMKPKVFAHKIFHRTTTIDEDNDEQDDNDSLFGDDFDENVDENYKKKKKIKKESNESKNDDEDEEKEGNSDNDAPTTRSRSHSSEADEEKMFRQKYKIMTEDDVCAAMLKKLIRAYYSRRKEELLEQQIRTAGHAVAADDQHTKNNIQEKIIKNQARDDLIDRFICAVEIISDRTDYGNHEGAFSKVLSILTAKKATSSNSDSNESNNDDDDSPQQITPLAEREKSQRREQLQPLRTALMHAAASGFIKCVRIILHLSPGPAYLNFRDSVVNKSTLLHCLSASDSIPAVPPSSSEIAASASSRKRSGRRKNKGPSLAHVASSYHAVSSDSDENDYDNSLKIKRAQKMILQKTMRVLFEYAKKFPAVMEGDE